MENASKAFIMAAEVLVGVIIISIAVYLFTMFAQHSQETYEKMSEAQISQFNSQFLKYYGSNLNEEGQSIPITCTAHDIITVANLAQQNNAQYDLLEETKFQENSFYIQVDIRAKTGNKTIKANLEKWLEEEKINFLKNAVTTEGKAKEYICQEVHISTITKRVNDIVFKEK